jgi:hypothetical protein
MIAANMAVFELLDQYSARAGAPLSNAEAARWIATSEEDRRVLKHFELSSRFRISPTKVIGRFDQGTDSIFLMFGFSEGFECPSFPGVDVGAGLLTAGLAELRPQPTASALEIANVVEAGDKTIAGYDGHDAASVAALFPRVTGVAGQGLAEGESGRIFFKLCLEEALSSASWIDASLGRDLNLLYSLDLLEVPFHLLSRALFDVDPASLFLALYRSVEFLYVYTSAQKLKATLSLSQDWATIGAALEEDLGWYPREANSLQLLLDFADPSDLAMVVEAISGSPTDKDASNLSITAGRLIYNLRNSIVHFRPMQRQLDRDTIDWQKLCGATVQIVVYVYSEIFDSL